MYESSSISISRLLWRVVRVGLYVAMACTVLFFALTRTEVGRDTLRKQLQSSFNQRFSGTLEIGSLEGTLLNDLTAKNVTLFDEKKNPVGTIDSIYARPRWTDLLTRNLSARSLTLDGVHLELHRDSNGVWNAQRALSRTFRANDSPPRSFNVNVTDVTVRNGRVTTSRAGEAPSSVQEEWLFDYTQSEITNVRAGGTIEWTDTDQLVHLDSLSLQLPDEELSLTSAQGEITKIRSQWALNDLGIQLGNTQLQAEGTIQPTPLDSSRSALDLQLSESRLDHDELRRLIPRLPLRDVVTVEGRLGGSLDRLLVNDLTVAHNRSEVRVEGTAFGLPDSLSLDAQVLDSQVTPSDLRRVWPHSSLDRLQSFGPLRLNATLNGLIEWRDRPNNTFDLESTFSASGQPGAARGSLDVERSSSTLQYTGTVETDTLNLAAVTGESRLASRLTGRATLDGRGETFRTLQSNLNVTLASGFISSHQFTAGRAQVRVSGRTAQGELSFQQSTGGSLDLQGQIDATGSAPRYRLASTAQNYDLAGTHPRLPSTRLNASLTTQARGESWQTLGGSIHLEVDSSIVQRGDSTVVLPAHHASLDVSPPTQGPPRIQLDGTIASVTIEGTDLGPPLWASGRLWLASFRRALERELTPTSPSPSDSTLSPGLPASLRTQAQNALVEANVKGPLQLRGEGTMHRMDLLRKWWSDAPSEAENLKAKTTITLSPDTLHSFGSLTAHRLVIDERQVDTLQSTYEVSGPLHPELLDALTTELSVQADTLQMGTQTLASPSFFFSLDHGKGSLRAEADGFGRTGPFQLTSGVALRGGRTEFTLRDLYVGAGQHAWISKDPSSVSVHADAVVFDSLELESQRPLTDGTQRLRLHGTLSPNAADTLYADVSDVLLYPLSQLAALPRSLGGRMNGQIAITGGWSQPQVQSTLDVHRLSIDRRILGTLQVQSRIAPNTPDLLVDASLVSQASSVDSLSGPDLVPQGPRSLEKNKLQMNGRIRVPRWPGSESSLDPQNEQLDLNVSVDRADLFFFKYIFDDTLDKAQGATSGSIHVGGRFRHPIFTAQMEIEDAYFTLPQFGLAYNASGPVDVDRDGVHLRDLNVTDGSGSATVQGSLLFNDYRYFSFDLSGELDELSIIDVADAGDLPFYGQIRASGPVSLTGPLPDATLRSERARTTPDSELFIPVSEGGVDQGSGFIIFADSTGQLPDLQTLGRRDNILSDRPAGEPSFLEGLEIDINVVAPEESTVNLVFDPIVGDVVEAVGSGRVQLQRQEGDFLVYGNFNVTDGSYLFTAGEVFVRRFDISEGTLTWDGPPTNALLDIQAEYRTRASSAGLPGYEDQGRIPVRVLLDISDRVETPRVELSLARVRDERSNLLGSETLDAILNRPDRTTEYATSVLLTNTFLLTTESFTQGQNTGPNGTRTSGTLTTAGNQLAFNSVSQLVASQLNRYLGAALPNVDLNFGLQGENPNDLDVIYGVALRLLNERLVIQGEGVYTGDDPDQRQAQGPQGEFVVELRLSNQVSVEAFYRRTGDELTRNQTLTSSTGAGLSYQTEFSTWRDLFHRVFGWLLPAKEESDDDPELTPSPAAREDDADSDRSDRETENATPDE